MDAVIFEKMHDREDLKSGKFFELAYVEKNLFKSSFFDCDLRTNYSYIMFFSDMTMSIKLMHFNTSHEYPVIGNLTENFSDFIAGEYFNGFYACMYALDTFKLLSTAYTKIPNIKIAKQINFYTGYAPIDDVIAVSNGVLLWTFQAAMLIRMVVDDAAYADSILKDYRASAVDIYKSTRHLKLHGVPILRLLDDLQPSQCYYTSPNIQGAKLLFDIVNKHGEALKDK